MMQRNAFVCIDRATGDVRQDRVYTPVLLDWCYNSLIGRAVMDGVLIRPWVSRLYGWLQKRSCRQRRLRAFCETMGVDLSESVHPLEFFRSLNDLIVRRIDLSRRPINGDPAVCVAPVDGRFLVYPRLAVDTPFSIKRLLFDLRSFLRDDTLAATFDGGAMAVARLDLADYHHFHFPCAGAPRTVRTIRGRYHAMSPYARRGSIPVFRENTRAIVPIDTDAFGCIVMAEVGAFTVGSIRQCFVTGRRAAKGDHKGYFEFGASLVALLFPPETIMFDNDLLTNSAASMETYVRLGESIGRKVHGSLTSLTLP